uniref:SSD domain-containing protein n=1 Tax=Panagrolaimus superbus TaxID=310955 RepID=A0A914YKX5_9BILA
MKLILEILEFGLYHNESLPEGLQDVADALTPKFVMMSGILFVFTLGCSVVILRHENLLMGIDWVRSKPILGLAALVCPLLAVGSAFGLVLWTGEYYNAIVNISPFIVVCIGIDDAFLMNAAWHRTNPELSPARRLAETLSEAAVAISITSFTDMVIF